MSSDEKLCEDIYKASVKKENQHYTVDLPFKTNLESLGESRKTAVARLLQLEKKFQKDNDFREEYSKFMGEYEKLNHMRKLKVDEIRNSSKCYYIPHHAVIKEKSTTTKLRVVFDASAKSSNGISLNDKLLVGPTIQLDLWTILTKWRQHKYVFTADV